MDFLLSIYRLRETLWMIMYDEKKNYIEDMKTVIYGVDERHRHILFGYDQLETTLYQAVERGQKDVVECLVESGAHIELGIFRHRCNFTPLYIAVRHGNLPIVKLLVKLGANVKVPTFKDSTLVNEACEHGHITVAKYLISKGVKIHSNGHVRRAGHSMNYLVVALMLECDINCTDKTGKNSLFFAVSIGRYRLISYLIKHKIDILHRDENGENVLNVALNKKDQALIDYVRSFYSPKDIVKTYEIHGAQMALSKTFLVAFTYWKQAFDLRTEFSLPMTDPGTFRLGKNKLITSTEELSEKQFNAEAMMFQALYIFLYSVSPYHDLSRSTACQIHFMGIRNLYVENDLLIYIFLLNWFCPDPFSFRLHDLFESIVSFYSQRNFEFELVSNQTATYMDFVEERVWPGLLKLKNMHGFELDQYKTITKTIMECYKILLNSDAPQEQKTTIVARLGRMMKREKSLDLPSTFLHHTPRDKDLLSTKLLVQCGADVNAVDFQNNTPLHIAIAPDITNVDIAKFLVKYGSDVDAVSAVRIDLPGLLKTHGVVVNNFDKISLKCLAAKALSKNKITVYADECPQSLIPIIKRHGGTVSVR